MMHWFGDQPFSNACIECPRVPVPVGVPCSWCDEPIDDTDHGYVPSDGDGDPIHAECSIRQVVGSVAHQTQTCSCYGGTLEDDPGLSRREAAHEAARLFLRTRERRRKHV